MNRRNENMFTAKIYFLLITFVFYSSIFSAYIGTTIFTYLIMIYLILSNINRFKFSPFQIIAIIILIVYSIIVIGISNDYLVAIKNIRFWLGIIFYLIFLTLLDLNKFYTPTFFRIVCYSVFLELVLINSLDYNYLINFINVENYKHFNFYFRPLGFTGSPSMTSSLIVVLFFLTEKINGRMQLLDWILFILAVLLTYSSSGYIIFLLYLIFKSSDLIKQVLLLNIFGLSAKNAISLILTAIVVYYAYKLAIILGNEEKVGTNFHIYSRVSSDYILHIFNLKFTEYSHTFGLISNPIINCDLACRATISDSPASTELIRHNFSLIQLFGYQILNSSPSTSGHNGLTIFLYAMGLFGISIYALLLLSFYRAGNNMIYGVVLILIASLHYPSAMSAAGQLLLASMIIYNAKKIKI
jgi:hypothetical protein